MAGGNRKKVEGKAELDGDNDDVPLKVARWLGPVPGLVTIRGKNGSDLLLDEQSMLIFQRRDSGLECCTSTYASKAETRAKAKECRRSPDETHDHDGLDEGDLAALLLVHMTRLHVSLCRTPKHAPKAVKEFYRHIFGATPKEEWLEAFCKFLGPVLKNCSESGKLWRSNGSASGGPSNAEVPKSDPEESFQEYTETLTHLAQQLFLSLISVVKGRYPLAPAPLRNLSVKRRKNWIWNSDDEEDDEDNGEDDEEDSSCDNEESSDDDDDGNHEDSADDDDDDDDEKHTSKIPKIDGPMRNTRSKTQQQQKQQQEQQQPSSMAKLKKPATSLVPPASREEIVSGTSGHFPPSWKNGTAPNTQRGPPTEAFRDRVDNGGDDVQILKENLQTSTASTRTTVKSPSLTQNHGLKQPERPKGKVMPPEKKERKFEWTDVANNLRNNPVKAALFERFLKELDAMSTPSESSNDDDDDDDFDQSLKHKAQSKLYQSPLPPPRPQRQSSSISSNKKNPGRESGLPGKPSSSVRLARKKEQRPIPQKVHESAHSRQDGVAVSGCQDADDFSKTRPTSSVSTRKRTDKATKNRDPSETPPPKLTRL